MIKRLIFVLLTAAGIVFLPPQMTNLFTSLTGLVPKDTIIINWMVGLILILLSIFSIIFVTVLINRICKLILWIIYG